MQWKNEADVDDYVKEAFKEIESNNLDFLENKKSFESFYKELLLTEEDKHNILIRGQIRLEYHSKNSINSCTITTSPPRKECFMSLECY